MSLLSGNAPSVPPLLASHPWLTDGPHGPHSSPLPPLLRDFAKEVNSFLHDLRGLVQVPLFEETDLSGPLAAAGLASP